MCKLSSEEESTVLNAYEKYQLEWMIEHGFSLGDLMGALDEYSREGMDANGVHPADMATLPQTFDDWAFDKGFDGALWSSEPEWKETPGEGVPIGETITAALGPDAIEKMTSELQDVLVDDDGRLLFDWYGYPAGTDREEIWLDIDEAHPDGYVEVCRRIRAREAAETQQVPQSARDTVVSTLRDMGYAVKTDSNSMTVSRPGVEFNKYAGFTVPMPSDDSPIRSWARIINRLASNIGPSGIDCEAHTAATACRQALAENLRARGTISVRDAYTEAHPNEMLGSFIDPLLTFEDLWSFGGKSADNIYDFLGVRDGALLERVADLTASRYGFTKDEALRHFTNKEPFIGVRAIEDLESNGALFNRSTNSLAVSFLADPDPEILVFDCTEEDLEEGVLAALHAGCEPENMCMQEVIDSNLPFIQSARSYPDLEALASSGFFSGAALTSYDADMLDNYSNVRDVLDIAGMSHLLDADADKSPDLDALAADASDARDGGCGLVDPVKDAIAASKAEVHGEGAI